jgi:hypothetical protein
MTALHMSSMQVHAREAWVASRPKFVLAVEFQSCTWLAISIPSLEFVAESPPSLISNIVGCVKLNGGMAGNAAGVGVVIRYLMRVQFLVNLWLCFLNVDSESIGNNFAANET